MQKGLPGVGNLASSNRITEFEDFSDEVYKLFSLIIANDQEDVNSVYLRISIEYLNAPVLNDYSAQIIFTKKDGIKLDDIVTSDGNSWYDYFMKQL